MVLKAFLQYRFNFLKLILMIRIIEKVKMYADYKVPKGD